MDRPLALVLVELLASWHFRLLHSRREKATFEQGHAKRQRAIAAAIVTILGMNQGCKSSRFLS